MKNILLSAVFIAASFTSFAQTGIGTTTPHASAQLDVSSTTKGFLPPRMTLTQMNAIASPVEGLLVYCADCNPKGQYYYDGTDFSAMMHIPPPPTVTSLVTNKIWMDRNLSNPFVS